MPKREGIKKVLMIGSGPIVIGQAAEFDYSGTQACRALREEGIEVVLINSNPATIMTDRDIADHIYIEPLIPSVVEKIIEKERPDSLLPTMGGQTGLNLAMELHESGVLDRYNVRLLGAVPATIRKAEDREGFKTTMLEIGEPCIPSDVVTDVEAAVAFAQTIGYPVIVRPAYTLGGSGGGIAEDEKQLRDIAQNGLRLSRVHQVLIERCVSGWKEIEYEVMRDSAGNVICICSMENVDPVGIHTGDSIVVAPTQTLSDREYQMLRSAAINIISALEIEGGCNIQFALDTDSFEYAVIEVNPRVSRSSALASKATGYPIAKVATKIAIGYTLEEIPNSVTGKTCACFEPTIDYCVVKFPKWPFDKFVYARRTLGTQMKATGEVMAIGTSFEQALMKAVRSIERNVDTLRLPRLSQYTDEELFERIAQMDDDRLFLIYEALSRGHSVEKLYECTRIDPFFLYKLVRLLEVERMIAQDPDAAYAIAKEAGYTDRAIEAIGGKPIKERQYAIYKTVDTCAAEFEAQTPYYYAAHGGEDESFVREGKKALVIGSGPIRIGQGIEFDYCTVHAVWALQECGYQAIVANNNPETVSTDFDTSDRLYFDPLTPEDIDNVIRAEQPDGVIVQFGGQTAIKLAKHLSRSGVPILGTSAEMVDAAEDRERFDALLERCGIPRPAGKTVYTVDQALAAAESVGYPVLLRPSYVLGGQNMIIAYAPDDVVEYMDIILRTQLENPVLIDKYLMGKEVEVDAICDGEDILIPGIMEHLERAGIHSGDSISVYPPQTLTGEEEATLIDYTTRLARELNVVGMVNIQFVIYRGTTYVIEVNPRSSRTVPYISKVTGVPMIKIATKCALGYKLRDMGYGSGLYQRSAYTAVKVPVFSFEKLHNVDVHLGPEMKSTGEVLGIAESFGQALLKGLVAAGFKMKRIGNVLITVRDQDKPEMLPLARGLHNLGFKIHATRGTAAYLNQNGVPAYSVHKIGEGTPDIIDLLEAGKIDYVLSTSTTSRGPELDAVRIRRKATERSIPCLTAIDTARALLDCLEMNAAVEELDLIDIAKMQLNGTKPAV